MSAGEERPDDAEGGRGCPPLLVRAAGWLIAAAAVVLGRAGRLGGRAGGGHRG